MCIVDSLATTPTPVQKLMHLLSIWIHMSRVNWLSNPSLLELCIWIRVLVVRLCIFGEDLGGNYAEGAHLLQSRVVIFCALLCRYFLQRWRVLWDANAIDFNLAHFNISRVYCRRLVTDHHCILWAVCITLAIIVRRCMHYRSWFYALW